MKKRDTLSDWLYTYNINSLSEEEGRELSQAARRLVESPSVRWALGALEARYLQGILAFNPEEPDNFLFYRHRLDVIEEFRRELVKLAQEHQDDSSDQ